MKKIPIRLGPRSYDILIGTSVLAHAGEHISALPVRLNAVIITNTTVAPLYLHSLKDSLHSSGFSTSEIILPDGERYKTLQQVSELYTALSHLGLDRTTPLIALGGGVIGDIAGFAAATFLRGVPFIQIPTTLLSQVDSSVGGKTGVNLPAGKNLVGAFYQPRIVLIDPGVLRTLDRREFTSGMAEVIKYAIIREASFFDYLAHTMSSACSQDPDVLLEIIARCCSIKAAITEQDETEQNVRAVLNFGHTVGHALETLTEYRTYTHGEAVAIGMHAAACFSISLGFCPHGVVSRIDSLLTSAGLPSALPRIDSNALCSIMLRDKKRSGDAVRMVVLNDIGDARLTDISSAQILSVLNERSVP